MYTFKNTRPHLQFSEWWSNNLFMFSYFFFGLVIH